MRLRLLLFILILPAFATYGQSRKVIYIPDIPGFRTLKCDFHMHTIFSDGTVWPTIRVEEAWRDGLDAISITDHIEYRPHSTDVTADHNRSYNIAEPMSKSLNILLIKGAEITRSMPPGHLNALFIRNANLLDRENVFDAIREARDQGAFIFWNHPGWKAQQPDTTVWWAEHTQLLKSNMIHGVEVFNYDEYYPEAIDWAREKKLTMLANSDLHEPSGMKYGDYDTHRPMTLVFSKSRTEGGIREALFNQRTVAFYNNTLVGRANLLEPLFFSSMKIITTPGVLRNEGTKKVEIINTSDIHYELELVQPGLGFDAPAAVTLKPHHMTMLELSGNSGEVAEVKELKVFYRVKNMLLSSTENLVITFSIPNI